MQFNSFAFMAFFPLAAAGYFLCPKRVNYLWLLAVSAFFYMCWKPAYILLIGLSIAMTWLCGLALSKLGAEKTAARRAALALCVCANLAILFFFKYYGFAAQNLARIGIALPALSVALPIGISFYTFQALGYAIDVYRGTIPAERHPLRYAAFILFFPQLVAGPIERAGDLLPQFYEEHNFDYERARSGLLLMGWGFFEKMVIADRAALLVDSVFADLPGAAGMPVLAACVLFTVQIYCDFASYSHIAVGAARVLGFRLSRNFNAPLLSVSIRDFWRRWHISLSGWLRDYVYIPLGGSRKGRVRRAVNLLITFLISGIWHGAAWTYVLWGLMHGIGQITEDIFCRFFGSADNPGTLRRCVGHVYTFCFVAAAFAVFRAESLAQAAQVFTCLFTNLHLSQLWDGTLLNWGLDKPDWLVLLAALLILFAADRFGKSTEWVDAAEKKSAALRWVLYLALFFAVFLFGIYGVGTVEKPFIYFQF